MQDRCRTAFYFDELEEYDAAIAEMDAVVDKRPSDYVALNNRGVMCFELGRTDQAESDLAKACILSTTDPLPHENMGNFWEKLGKHDLAIASYRRALELSPYSAFARNRLADLLSAD